MRSFFICGDLQDGNVAALDLAAELGDAEFSQFVEPGDVIGDSSGAAVLARRRNVVVALVGESAAEIVKFLLAVVRGGEEARGARLDLHGDEVSVLEAMAVRDTR